MASEPPRTIALVVDANVARSAGDLEADDPTTDELAVGCAQALNAIAGTPALYAVAESVLDHEWEVNASDSAVRWQRDMVVQGRHELLENVADAALASAVASLPKNDRVPAGKDVHLVELALATNSRILSHEKNARRRFAKLTGTMAELCTLHWVSPVEPNCLTWLTNGAPDEPAYYLTELPNW